MLLIFSANWTGLKGELLHYFQDNGIQKQSNGKKCFYYFQLEIQMLQNIPLSYSEALQLAAVAKNPPGNISSSNKLIEELYHYGISISYERVMQRENDIAHSLCGQYQASEVVCPSVCERGYLW